MKPYEFTTDHSGKTNAKGFEKTNTESDTITWNLSNDNQRCMWRSTIQCTKRQEFLVVRTLFSVIQTDNHRHDQGKSTPGAIATVYVPRLARSCLAFQRCLPICATTYFFLSVISVFTLRKLPYIHRFFYSPSTALCPTVVSRYIFGSCGLEPSRLG